MKTNWENQRHGFCAERPKLSKMREDFKNKKWFGRHGKIFKMDFPINPVAVLIPIVPHYSGGYASCGRIWEYGFVKDHVVVTLCYPNIYNIHQLTPIALIKFVLVVDPCIWDLVSFC
jgi:hypothetical protein